MRKPRELLALFAQSAAERARRLVAFIRQNPFDASLWLIAVAATFYVIAYPFLVVRYPPMTDLPFHASATSIFRHYWDASWGFQQQFTLHPLQSPYIATYVLGAFFALVMPITWATKLTAILMLGLLPAGLALLFYGMKKSPLWGVLGLGPVWSHLTHWGFVNFMGAIGLFAMSIGFALLLLDRPTRARAVGLTLSIAAIFFTHLFRFPFAILAVAATAVVVYPATRRIRPVLIPLAINVVLYGLWMLVPHPAEFKTSPKLKFDSTRLHGMERYLVDGFTGQAGIEEHALFTQLAWIVVAAACLALGIFFAERRARDRSPRERWWAVAVTLLPLIFAVGFFLGFLVLPMQIGLWWYVFPREVTPAVYILLAAAPDLPSRWWLKLPILLLLVFGTGRIGYHVAKQYFAFEHATADFREITTEIPKNPKLLYLIVDHDGSTRSVTPFIHLPAWVQAEKGGALSFHFVGWGHNPIAYRLNSPDVPPPVPERWEWRPDLFNVRQHGTFFDWFLVRSRFTPEPRFAADPSIHLVDQRGTWWLFRRETRH